MKYQEFCNQFKKGILKHEEWNIREEDYKFYPDGYMTTDKKELTLIRETNEKYFGIKADVLKGDFAILQLKKGKDLVNSRYYMPDLYAVYQEDNWSGVWKVIEDHMSILRRHKNTSFVERFDSYENAREHLIIRAINYTDNEVQLEEHIYRRFADIALVVYMVIYDNGRDFGTAKLPKSCAEKWNKSPDELFEIALTNTIKRMPPRLYENPWEIVDGPEVGKFMEEDWKIDRRSVTLVKTTHNINGAIALFYPGVKERIAQMMDGSFYVAFTSIHEAHVHHVGSVSPQRIQYALDDMNDTFPQQEILSRKVFLYDAEEKTFEALEC